jgi:hypothetical protein
VHTWERLQLRLAPVLIESSSFGIFLNLLFFIAGRYLGSARILRPLLNSNAHCDE